MRAAQERSLACCLSALAAACLPAGRRSAIAPRRLVSPPAAAAAPPASSTPHPTPSPATLAAEDEAAGDEHAAKRLRVDEGHGEGLAIADGAPSEEMDLAMAAALAAAAAGASADGTAAAPSDEAAATEEVAAAAAAQLLQHQQQQQQQQQGGAVPLPLDPAAAAALGITPEQQAHMQQLMQFPLLSPEALAAASANLPTGPDGQPLPLALPFMGPGGEHLPQLALDASALNIPILAPDGSQLTPEQLMQLFSSNAMPFVIPLAAGQGLPPGMTIGPDGNPVYKNWWDEKDEKVGRAAACWPCCCALHSCHAWGPGGSRCLAGPACLCQPASQPA